MRAEIIFGVHEGYNRDNNTKVNIKDVVKQLHPLILKNRKINMYYISGIVSECVAIYKEEDGCPEDGETVFKFTTVWNPAKNTCMHLWTKAVESLAKLIKEEFNQTTITLEYIRSDLKYLKDDNDASKGCGDCYEER